MVTVIHVTAESLRAVKPRAGADEYAAGKPFWAVVARRSAAVRSGVVVSIGTSRLCSDSDDDLSRRFWSGDSEQQCSKNS
jgi:hypothetical protein